MAKTTKNIPSPAMMKAAGASFEAANMLGARIWISLSAFIETQPKRPARRCQETLRSCDAGGVTIAPAAEASALNQVKT